MEVEKSPAILFYLQTYLDESSLGLFHRLMDTLNRNIHLHSIRVAVTLTRSLYLRCTLLCCGSLSIWTKSIYI